MADRLATPADLASILQSSTVDASTAGLVLDLATGIVQGAALQRLILVEDDEIELLGTTSAFLRLPERPVVEVTEVLLDGEAITDYEVRGDRLWREDGWQTEDTCTPSEVGITYSHGLADGDQDLQLARSFTLALAAGAYTSPGGGAIVTESIDDYSVRFAEGVARMELSKPMIAALRRKYGRRAGFVRLG